MSTPTGQAIIAAINQILELQTKEAQDAKQTQAIELLGAFARENNVPAQTGAVSTLSRLLRNLGRDTEVIRQVRSMSDSLLNKDEQELENELMVLRDQLMPIEARIHQVKTKTAFVATVVRPFSPKYAASWFHERKDIDVSRAKVHIDQLETAQLNDINEVSDWARGVAELFEQLVVYRGEDAADFYSRPSGTVSEKSSRTYLQAWTAFIEKFKEEIWRRAVDSESNQDQSRSSPKSSRRNDSISMGAYESDKLELNRNVSKAANKSFFMSLERPAAHRVSKPRATEPVGWIQIFIESKIDASAQATRKWESQSEFQGSLQKWLDTLPVIWGPAANQFVAKVSVKTRTGESDLTLPSLTVGDAAERLIKAVEMQQD
jgi:hypothetical protein